MFISSIAEFFIHFWCGYKASFKPIAKLLAQKLNAVVVPKGIKNGDDACEYGFLGSLKTKNRMKRMPMRFCCAVMRLATRLFHHIMHSCFNVVIAQSGVAPFGRHGIEAIDGVLHQSLFALFDARCPVFVFGYFGRTGDGRSCAVAGFAGLIKNFRAASRCLVIACAA